MKTVGIVMVHEPSHNPPSLFERQWAQGTDTFLFQALMPTLNLPVTLGVVWGSPYMTHAADAYELLEIPGNKLRTVI